MSDLGYSLERIRKQASSLERLERALAGNPGDRKIQLSVLSLRKLIAISRAEFDAVCAENSRDVVKYKIGNRSEKYLIAGLAESCASFQNLITSICDALINGPKVRSNFSDAILQATSLSFGYTFPGSVGFVLSVENERDLFQGKLDDTVDAFGQLLEISSADQAKDASRRLGLSTISALSKWVDVNLKWDNDIDYIWKRSDGVERGGFLPVEKLAEIHDILDGTLDSEITQIEAVGVLVGLDVEDEKFHFVVPDGEDYKGGLGDDFSRTQRTVPKRYRTIIETEISRNISTGKVWTKHTLIDLIEI